MNSLELASARLAAAGAVFEVPSCPPHQFLVGELCWLDQNRLFWFTAHGDREEDGHLLAFETAEMIGNHSVVFHAGGAKVASLTCIADAQVPDPEDYTVAFSLWQQVAPQTKPLIRRSLAQFEEGDEAAQDLVKGWALVCYAPSKRIDT